MFFHLCRRNRRLQNPPLPLLKDLAITTWVGKMEYVAKSGDKTTTDPIAYTGVFKKIDGQWKVIYEHASARGEVTEKAGKK